jgi:large subunit ribosomal protein L10
VPTQEKVTAVEDIKGRLEGARAVVLAEYRGLTVQQLSELRKQLRAVSAQYKVVKNRLAKIAIASTELQALAKHLTGPTGMIVSREDPVAVAKALQTFARTNQALAIKAGVIEGQVLEPAGLRALAELPSRDALRSQIVGALQGPQSQLVGLLLAPQRELAYILAQRGKDAVAETNGQGQ